MRILHTSELYSPSVGGAQEVVRQISERLATRGHKVVVATTRLPDRSERALNGVRIEEFSIAGNPVAGYTGEIDRYRQLLRDGNFDVMLNYAAQQWTTDLAYEVLDELPFRKVLAPCGFSGLRDPGYASYFARLPAILQRYDHLVLHSDIYQDATFVRDHGLSRFSVIPNGAAEEEFEASWTGFRSRYAIPDGATLLLSVGTHTGLKGHGLVIEALRRARIGPTVLVLIGNRPRLPHVGCWPACVLQSTWTGLTSRGLKKVLTLDLPRNEVLAAFQAADLFVFGSAVECAPIVLYEAMAAGLPFVTVACGNAAEIAGLGGGVVVDTQVKSNGQVTADPVVLARAIERLVRDPKERQRLGKVGRDTWRQRYTWNHIAQQYERLYSQLIAVSPVAT